MRAVAPLVCVCVALSCAGERVCEPVELVHVEQGTSPILVTSTHAGVLQAGACGVALDKRACSAALDAACWSGPCRADKADRGARALTRATVDALTRCMGAPSLVQLEVERSRVDVNRDKDDEGGPRCAYDDPDAEPVWDAFYAALDATIARHVARFGADALLIDLHTHGTMPGTTPPVVVLGAGDPFGETLPRRAAHDPTLPLLFGEGGVAQMLQTELLASFPSAEVLPVAPDVNVGDLFAGRHVLVHASAMMDALQIEISDGLRQQPEWTGEALGDALCSALLREHLGATDRSLSRGAP